MAIITRATYIRTNDVQNNPYTMIRDLRTTLDQNRYPIVLSPREIKQINFSQVENILRGGGASPSAMAGIAEHDRCGQILGRIDDCFWLALRKYRSSFEIAVESDSKSIDSQNQALVKRLDNASYTTRYTLGMGGVAALLMFAIFGSRFIFPGKGIGSIAGFTFAGGGIGGLAGIFIGGNVDKNKERNSEILTDNTRREQSAARRDWLIRVDASETKRLEDMENSLTLRMMCLNDALDQMGGEYDSTLVREFRQLIRVYQTQFPETPLKIADRDPTVYLNQITAT